MSMEKKNLLYLFASFCLLVAMTVGASRLREAEKTNEIYKNSDLSSSSSRLPASVRLKKSRQGVKRSKGFLLSRAELLALKEKDLEKYLRGVAKAIAKAGKKNPKLFYDSSVRTSSIWLYLQSEAFAQNSASLFPHPISSFEDGCLIGFVAAVKADCENGRSGFLSMEISSATRERFSSLTSNGRSAKCPDGRQMCSPALYGFNFDANDKASLICLPNASGQECFNEISTNGQGDRLKKSLDLLAEANPDFWSNLGKGITQICKPTSGGPDADATKADCALLKRQLFTLSQESRGALDEYKNLYALANGDTNTLDSLSDSGVIPGDGGESVSCSAVEAAMKSQVGNDLDFNQLSSLRGASRSQSTNDLLRFASIACDKSPEELVARYGECSLSRPSNFQNSFSNARAQASTKANEAREILELINVLPANLRDQLDEGTSLVRARSILAGNGSSRETREIYQKWEAFYRSYVNTSVSVPDRNPFKVFNSSRAISSDSLFEQTLNNAINGGVLSPDQLKYLTDFRHNYGMDPINIKSLFCPDNDAESHTFPDSLVANENNFRNYTLECLKEMGFGSRRQRPRTVTYPIQTSDGSGVTQRNCSWNSVNYNSSVNRYFEGGSSGLPDNLYLKLNRRNSVDDSCQKIEPCTYSRPGTPVQSTYSNSHNRGIMRDGVCISSVQALTYLSSFKDQLSTISCSVRRSDGDTPRTLSPAEIIEQDRGSRVID